MFSLWQRIDSYHNLKGSDKVIVSNLRHAICIEYLRHLLRIS